jgi:hypothetical protein
MLNKKTKSKAAKTALLFLLIALVTALSTFYYFKNTPKSADTFYAVSSEEGEIGALAIYLFAHGRITGTCQLCYIERIFCNRLTTINANKQNPTPIITTLIIPQDTTALLLLHQQMPEQFPATFQELVQQWFSNADTTLINELINQLNFNENKINPSLQQTLMKELNNRINTNCTFCPDTLRFPTCKEKHSQKLTINFDFLSGTELLELQKNNCTQESDIDIWIQDHYWVTQTDSNKLKIIYSKYDNRAKKAVAALKMHYPDLEEVPSNYIKIQGGNMLAGKNFIVIGEDFFQCNYKLLKDSFPTPQALRSNMEANIKQWTGKQHILWVGFDTAKTLPHNASKYKGYQPAFHIDLYITLGGIRNGKQVVYIARSKPEYYIDIFSGEKGKKREAIIKTLDTFLLSVKDDFINYQLQNNSLLPFDFIEQIPLMLVFKKEQDHTINEFIDRYKSYNNCIIENTYTLKDTLRTVYSPYYNGAGDGVRYIKYDSLKQVAKDCYTYSAKNNSVIFMEPPYDELNNGALNCITKVLYRKN